jgi:enterochelin esterase family protein
MRWVCCLFTFVACAGPSVAQDMPLYKDILIENEGWKPFYKDCKSVGGLAAAPDGGLWISDLTGKQTIFVSAAGPGNKTHELGSAPRGLFAGRNALFICLPEKKTVTSSVGDVLVKVVDGLEAHEVAVTSKGIKAAYVSVPSEGAIYFVGDEKPRKVAEGLKDPAGLVLWPDEGTLVVSEARGQHLLTYRIEKDGSLAHREGYYTLRKQTGTGALDVGGMTVDEKSRLYACTAEGVQVFDPTGRLCGVLLKPREAPLTHVALGGAKGDTLFVACGDEVFARKIKPKGLPWKEKPKSP